jgi:hypothetical protein
MPLDESESDLSGEDKVIAQGLNRSQTVGGPQQRSVMEKERVNFAFVA